MLDLCIYFRFRYFIMVHSLESPAVLLLVSAIFVACQSQAFRPRPSGWPAQRPIRSRLVPRPRPDHNHRQLEPPNGARELVLAIHDGYFPGVADGGLTAGPYQPPDIYIVAYLNVRNETRNGFGQFEEKTDKHRPIWDEEKRQQLSM